MTRYAGPTPFVSHSATQSEIAVFRNALDSTRAGEDSSNRSISTSGIHGNYLLIFNDMG